MICRDRKLIFIHIPKTGGTSIEDLLWPQPRRVEDLWGGQVAPGRNKYQTGGLQHLTARQIRLEVGDDLFNRCWRFALVRDPVDRLISQYNYLNRRGDLRRLLGLGPDRTFSLYLQRIQAAEHVQWKPQVAFLFDDDGAPLAKWFALERIGDDFPEIARRTGSGATRLTHSNKSTQRKGPRARPLLRREDLSDAELRMIDELFRDDFERLNYPRPGA